MTVRYHTVDALRGLALINMIIYHLIYDINTIYGQQVQWINNPLVKFWQLGICWSFILIAGFSWQWGSAHNLRRGIVLNLCGLAISLLSVIILPNHAIWFGILNFLGCAILLQCLIHPLTNRLAPLTGFILALIAHFLLRDLQLGVIGDGWVLPNVLYTNWLGAPLDLAPVYFTAIDYFPFLPWFPVFLCGVYLYRLFEQCPECQHRATLHIPVLSTLGRHSLAIYLLHQPVLLLLCYLLLGMPS